MARGSSPLHWKILCQVNEMLKVALGCQRRLSDKVADLPEPHGDLCVESLTEKIGHSHETICEPVPAEDFFRKWAPHVF